MQVEGLIDLATAAIAAPDQARPGEADSAFAAAAAVADSFVPTTHPLSACARCGAELARAQRGQAVDAAALEAALARCRGWGLANPRLIEQARATLAGVR